MPLYFLVILRLPYLRKRRIQPFIHFFIVFCLYSMLYNQVVCWQIFMSSILQKIFHESLQLISLVGLFMISGGIPERFLKRFLNLFPSHFWHQSVKRYKESARGYIYIYICVCVCVCVSVCLGVYVYIYVFTNPSAYAGCNIKSIFLAEIKRSEFRIFLLLDWWPYQD